MIKISLRQLLLLFLIIFSMTDRIKAQDEKFKAIFIYNFTRYINWPVKTDEFVVTILGNDPIKGEMESIAAKKMVGNEKIRVISINSISELGNCQIVYIARNKSDLLTQVALKAKEFNILIITDKSNACSLGAGINFVSSGGKLTFEISKQNIENCNLQINSALLSLGKLVN